jgi:hypothetical protein
MARRVWDVLLHNRTHRIKFEHGYFTGRCQLAVDGEPIPVRPHGVIDLGGEHPFEIDGVPCEVVITSNGLTFQYHLVVDGEAHPHGGRVPRPLRPEQRKGLLGAVNRYPLGLAVFFAVGGLAFLALGVQCVARLVSYPAHPPKVALAAAGAQPDDAWVMLEGLRADCGTEPIRLHGTNYYLAGHEGGGVPVAVAADTCPGPQASGLLHVMGGTNGAELRRLTGAPQVLVLSTGHGPANDRLGVAVCSLLAFPALALAWAFALQARHLSRARLAR